MAEPDTNSTPQEDEESSQQAVANPESEETQDPVADNQETSKTSGEDGDTSAKPEASGEPLTSQETTTDASVNEVDGNSKNGEQLEGPQTRESNEKVPEEETTGGAVLADAPQQSPGEGDTAESSRIEETKTMGEDVVQEGIAIETVQSSAPDTGDNRVREENEMPVKQESVPEREEQEVEKQDNKTINSERLEHDDPETDAIHIVTARTPNDLEEIRESSVNGASNVDNETVETEATKVSEDHGAKSDISEPTANAAQDSNEVDQVSEDAAKSEISEPATSIAKGSDKVVMFEDVKSETGNSDVDVDLPKSPTSIRELALSRQSQRTTTTMGTEFVYDENADFPTPDFYDRCLQQSVTPSITESEKLRQEAGSRRNLVSRGESNKSVTFADEVKGQEDNAEEDEKDEDNADGGEEGDGVVKAEEATEKQEPPSEEQDGVFSTAVSEEKIEEATARAKGKGQSISDTSSVAIDLWGQSKFELETMGDVVNKRATEHFEKGCKLADQGDHCQAILAFDKAINLCPKIVTYYLARGESYLHICDFQSAILNLKRACVLDPDNNTCYGKLAFVYYFYGQTLFDQNLFAEALEAFSRASEMRPEVVGYHTRSVACLAALQRHGECLALVNKRLEMEQDNPDLYIMRARLHELFRNTSLCYYDLRDALALDPNQEEACMLMKQLEVKAQESRNHSVMLQLQGKLKDALNKITTAIETNPSVAEYHLFRGALHRRLQDYNAAIDDYLLALDKTEHNEQDHIYTESQRQLLLTYNDFAVECFLGKHYEEAIILLNKALKGEKREKGLYINRGDCFFRLNELHFALADYHQALEIDSADWMIRSRIASIHSEFGLLDYEEHSYQEAEARFTVAIQHNPRMGSFYIYRAKVRFMLENQTDARQDLLMALHLDPSNDDILSLMPRLFPGKTVGDVMRSKAARMAKMAIDNAVVTASPIKLPEIRREGGSKGNSPTQQDGKTTGGTAKHVAFAANGVPPREASMPDIRSCMSETQFNKVLTKSKKKVSNHVKSLLHDRKSLSTSPLTLAPQPPPRPYTIKGGGWKKENDNKREGWKTFSLGMGIMNK